jgi:CTP:molybdopterin cytidylyltransferase MocA
VVVVTSPAGSRVRDLASALGARIAINRSSKTGPLGSIQCGLRELAGDPGGFLVFPVDHPLVAVDTLRRLRATFGERRPQGTKVCVPVHDGHKGHPELLDWRLYDEVMSLGTHETLRQVTLASPDRTVRVEVADRWTVNDLDDPDDYRGAVEWLAAR